MGTGNKVEGVLTNRVHINKNEHTHEMGEAASLCLALRVYIAFSTLDIV